MIDSDLLGRKTVKSMSALVRDYSREGDIICDPCAGSGTTWIAAKMNNRRFIGSEIDPDTHRAAMARCESPTQVDLWR